jgi:hypothetical protein
MDVHVPRAITLGLRLRGVDVLTAQEDGSAQLDDASLLRRAMEMDRILVSQDKDLLRIAAKLLGESTFFTGIIYAHQLRVSIGQMVDDLEIIAMATNLAEWRGRIEYVPI